MKYAVPIFVALCSPVMGSDLTPAQLREIQEFGAAGIDFSTTRREFLNRYPGAFQGLSTAGVTAYMIGDASGTASGIGVAFLDDELAVLALLYFSDKVDHYGVHALEASVSERFGPEYVVIKSKRIRRFPQIDRQVATRHDDDGAWSICIMRSSILEQCAARLGKSDFGF